jgi:hypothetical protein
MTTVASLKTVLMVLLVVCFCGTAQELDPKNPEIIKEGLSRAQAVVVGTFRPILSFPWFDGWHRSAKIEVEEVLFGASRLSSTAVPLTWVEPYLPPSHSCLVRSWFVNTDGIWFLAKQQGTWELSGTKAVWCGGPLPLNSRGAVLQAVGSHRNQERKHVGAN